MKTSDRSSKSLKNMFYGIGASLLQSFFPFISRTVFIYILGETYLGISGLFSSILSVLSLAELGIGNVVAFSLYKPLAEDDRTKLGAYIRYYKTIYRAIAGVVFGVGMALVPFIPYLIKLPENIDHIYLYYILYVVNSAISYLFVYKSAIIKADQKEYVISLYSTIFTALMNVAQVIALLIFKSFIVYLLIQLLFTFLQNYALSKKADRLYVLNGDNNTLSKEDRREIVSKTRAMLSYKLGGVFLNSTDSVYISTLVSTITVGLYTNYTILESFLNKFINILYNSLYASVGNLNATEGADKKKSVFDVLMFVFSYIGTVGFVGFFMLSSKVVEVWIGKTYCIEALAVLALALRFYLPIILYPIWMYRNTTGLFEETKGILIYAGILNLILSYILGEKWGLAGILFATSISRILTSFWYEPIVLYRKIFLGSRVSEYFINVLFSIVCIGVTIGCCLELERKIADNVYIQIICEVIACFIVPAVLYFIRYAKRKEWKYVVELIRKKLKKNLIQRKL